MIQQYFLIDNMHLEQAISTEENLFKPPDKTVFINP